MTQATVGYFLYDNSTVYFAARAYDEHPEQITARLTSRDADLPKDDSIIILLDTFHDHRTGYYFATNPLGTQMDGKIQDDGRVTDSTWDAPWTAAAAVTEDGWTAEFAIPLRSIQFRQGENMTWGVDIARFLRRNLETSVWSGPVEHLAMVSLAGELVGLNLETGTRHLELIPYVMGSYVQGRSMQGAGGFDLRYSFRPETTASVTVNPDFAMIEADQEFVNLTRFETQLSEKRPFFLESNEKFSQRIPIFYSRRIADIDAAGRLLSRNGPWDIAFLTASARVPGSTLGEARSGKTLHPNYSVGRIERQFMESSSLGLMASNRSLGGENQGAVGADTFLYLTRTVNLTGQVARSHGPHGSGNWAYFLRPSWDTATSHFHVRYTHLGDRFADNVNPIGFIRDDDRREVDSDLTKTLWFEDSRVKQISLSSRNNVYWSQQNVLRGYRNLEGITVELRNRWNFGAEHTNAFELFEQGFHNDTANFFFGYNTREYNSFDAGFITGRSFGSDMRSMNFAWRRKLTRALGLEYRLKRVWLDPDPENEATVINILRGQYTFTPDLLLRVFVQTNSVIDRRNAEVVFVYRYKPPFGAIQFAYQRGRAEVGQRSQQGNTFFLKISHVF